MLLYRSAENQCLVGASDEKVHWHTLDVCQWTFVFGWDSLSLLTSFTHRTNLNDCLLHCHLKASFFQDLVTSCDTKMAERVVQLGDLLRLLLRNHKSLWWYLGLLYNRSLWIVSFSCSFSRFLVEWLISGTGFSLLAMTFFTVDIVSYVSCNVFQL